EIVIGPNSSFADRSSDAATTANVKARFVQNAQGRFQATHVKVVTEAGTVFLMGIVRRSEADAATAIAAGSSGAKKVVEVFEYID
ncbi:MAG: BON domain-containing protein, partial [Burkholderiales bacterium]|nr:BON domain-containing protein [Burkholderiales bacterium]